MMLAKAVHEWKELVDNLERIISDSGNEATATCYWQLVQAYRNAQDLSNAEKAVLIGLEKYPDNPVLLSEWAWNAQVLKKWPEAILRLEKLVECLGEKVSEKIYIRLCRAHRENKQDIKAHDVAKRGLLKYPQSLKLKQINEHILAGRTQSIPDNHKGIVLLTTYPGHASKNVGDQLITSSTIKLIKRRMPDFNPLIIFRADSLDQYQGGSVKHIIAPGFSVSNKTYPDLFGLYSDLNRLPEFFPIGCSFQHIDPSHDAFDKYQYSEGTIEFLKLIADKYGALPCRDQLIVHLLQRHNIPAFYSGDLAIFDEDYLFEPFNPPRKINSVVFTIQHHQHYQAQSFVVLSLMKRMFPKADLFVAFHSVAGAKSQIIADYAVKLGFKELHLYGDTKNLDMYDTIDLHVGYRLHGHISFLRRRKPSVLLVEDARSFGFSQTKGTHVGCFNALGADGMADPNTPLVVMTFLEQQIFNSFQEYVGVFDFIDNIYAEVTGPYFDELVHRLKK